MTVTGQGCGAAWGGGRLGTVSIGNPELQLNKEKKKERKGVFVVTSHDFLGDPVPYNTQIEFFSIMRQRPAMKMCSENCPMTGHFFSRINETFLFLITLLSKQRPGEPHTPGC